MKKYLVTWEIDIEDANNPMDAATMAMNARNRKGSIANFFTVTDKDTDEVFEVDLHLKFAKPIVVDKNASIIKADAIIIKNY